MTFHLNTQDDLDAALRVLAAQDARLKPVMDMTGLAPLRRRAPGFAGLAGVICGQQLSTLAAAAPYTADRQRFKAWQADRSVAFVHGAKYMRDFK